MAQIVSIELLDFIKKGKKFLIAGHKEPDGDCVGSQIVLASVLRKMGKEVILCSAGPFKHTEVKPYERLFVPAPEEKDREGAWAILIDCSGLDRTGSLEPFLEGLPLAVIDHHKAGKYSPVEQRLPAEFPPDRLVYADAHSPSATLLIYEIVKALGEPLSREEAELLFLGLGTDTGFFRYVGKDGAEAFEAAAGLVRSGADPRAAYSAINGGKSLDSRRLLGSILTRAEALFGGKLIYSYEEYEDILRFGPESRDSDALYQLLQSIAGVEAIVVIRQETPERCTIGFRSRDCVDVGAIAAAFGGGGHKNAAGLSISGSISELKPKILKAFEAVFNL